MIGTRLTSQAGRGEWCGPGGRGGPGAVLGQGPLWSAAVSSVCGGGGGGVCGGVSEVQQTSAEMFSHLIRTARAEALGLLRNASGPPLGCGATDFSCSFTPHDWEEGEGARAGGFRPGSRNKWFLF